jgi:hypothetical protein
MDSNGKYGCGKNLAGKSCISAEAIEWFKSQKALVKPADIVFTTNPVPEMMKVANDCKFYGHQHQEVCCQAENMGLFDACKAQGINWIV